MSLCRYLPTPSDRMTVMWTLLTVEDALVLEYGPSGTTHYSMGLFGSMGIETNANLFTTHMNEDDVVMGDVSRLEKAIVELDDGYKPKVIFVVPSAISAVIGTDMRGVCHYMQGKVNARLLSLEGGGLKGDYTVGLTDAYNLMANELPNENFTRQDKTYNILGASAGSFRIRSDLWELEDLMSHAFTAKRIATFGLGSSIDELAVSSEACLNLVIRAEALPAAKIMEQRFGIPYIYNAPYGYKGTMEWLRNIEPYIGTSINMKVAGNLKKKEMNTMQIRRYINMYNNTPTATIVGDYDLVLGLAEFMRSIGIDVDNMICSHSMKHIDEPNPIIKNYKTEKARLDILRNIKNQIIFADDVSLHVCSDTNTKLCVSFPFIKHTQIAEHLPLMGIRGADYIMESVQNYLYKLE